MCQHENQQSSPASVSRRKKLWELAEKLHCPVMGLCLPTQSLRRAISKATFGNAAAEEYDLHHTAVANCKTRNKISECLQRELDSRCTLLLNRFKQAKTREALYALWQQSQGQMIEALWVTLTHPQCDESLQEQVYQAVHMQQHHACVRVQNEIAASNALLKENAVLTRELAKVQQRATRMVQEKHEQINQLNTELMQLRGKLIMKDTQIDSLQSQLNPIKNVQAENRELAARVERLQARLLRQESLLTQQRQPIQQLPVTVEPVAVTAPQPNGQALAEKTVLCVGGRQSNIPHYRHIIAEFGGNCLYHDGGIEDNIALLDSSIAAADLVICQTGCLSHKAYWRVKQHCKRSNKQCIYIENPSVSCLSRQLLSELTTVDVSKSY